MLCIKRKTFSVILINFGLFIFSTDLIAAGFRLPNQNAFATARGNAFAATANNASAIYYNPAGLTQLSGQHFETGVYSINFDVDAETDSGDFSNDDDVKFIPQLYYANETGDWDWGVGIYAPFGLGNDWDDTVPFSTITTSSEIAYITLSPVVARQVTPNLSVGVGLTINYADARLEQLASVATDTMPANEFEFNGDDIDVGYVLALLGKLGSNHRFGLTYRSEVEHDLSGDSIFSFVGESTSSRLSITVPALAVVGYAYQPNERWDFEVNVEWGDWSQLDQIVITDTSFGDIVTPFEWMDGFIYQIGGTRYFRNSAVSFGYDFNENVQSEAFFTPAVSDADRDFLNIGYTRFNDNNSWTATYQYGRSTRTVDGTLNPLTGQTADGDFTVVSHSVSFSYNFNF